MASVGGARQEDGRSSNLLAWYRHQLLTAVTREISTSFWRSMRTAQFSSFYQDLYLGLPLPTPVHFYRHLNLLTSRHRLLPFLPAGHLSVLHFDSHLAVEYYFIASFLL
jgi:hypothetical protein